VLLARDETFGREVALKQILANFGDDGRMRERFLLEARITGNLEHPGIVGVYSIGRDPDGRPFYAMRLIRGETLRDAIRRFHSGERVMRSEGARALALRKLINRLIAVCNAVAFAHSRGVLHRDIKPANVMIGKFGETLVVDWGLAKRVDKFVASEDQSQTQFDADHDDSMTRVESGMVVGTAAYMSPEQAEGRQDLMEPTSDVYSLGASLYEIVTGQVPFRGKKVFDILVAVRKGEFAPPSELNPAIDPALEAICLMAMAHAPEDRYATARAMADDLERWLADEPITAYREPVTKALSRWLSRHPHVLIRGLIAMVAFLLFALSGIVLIRLWW
jgi:eukaryotic-like serine/threonine-protein kinase